MHDCFHVKRGLGIRRDLEGEQKGIDRDDKIMNLTEMAEMDEIMDDEKRAENRKERGGQENM